MKKEKCSHSTVPSVFLYRVMMAWLWSSCKYFNSYCVVIFRAFSLNCIIHWFPVSWSLESVPCLMSGFVSILDFPNLWFLLLKLGFYYALYPTLVNWLFNAVKHGREAQRRSSCPRRWMHSNFVHPNYKHGNSSAAKTWQHYCHHVS